MKVMVRNDEHNIEIVYENVINIIRGCAGMFMIEMENGETATFHYIDREDNSEWDCFILKH